MTVFRNKYPTSTCQGRPNAPGNWLIYHLILTLVVCCPSFMISPIQLVYAQGSNVIIVQPPNTNSFPTISVDFKLPETGASASDGLSAEKLKIYENGIQVDITELTQQYRGILFTLVVNAASELDLRDAAGTSRYDKLSESLRQWVSARSFQGEDAWSLVTNEGDEVRYATCAADWVSGLETYQPNFRALQPDLSGLESAVRMLAERVVPLGMDKVILYLTPPPTPEQIEGIQALAAEARAAQIQINVWMMGDPLYLDNDQGSALMDLAALTGGEFFHYTGEESISNPETYLSSLGAFYTATYESNLSQSGTYPLRVESSFAGMQFSGESHPFIMDIQPPNPMFVSPQTEVTIQAQSETASASVLRAPEYITWQIMVAFPDGHPREIIASRLYMDGNIVGVNKAPPFDVFTWEIPTHIEVGEHAIQAEVEDSIGLTAQTILTPLTVIYHQPEPLSSISIQRIAFILIGILLGVALFLLILWLLRRYTQEDIFKPIKDNLLQRKTEPHPDNPVPAQFPGSILATLTPLDNRTDAQAVHLTHGKTTLGTDPDRAQTLVFGEDVQDMHALIHVREKGVWIQDLNTHSGTWVNYGIIGTENVQIHIGDLIHFGSTGFRFTINEDPSYRRTTVSKYEPYL